MMLGCNRMQVALDILARYPLATFSIGCVTPAGSIDPNCIVVRKAPPLAVTEIVRRLVNVSLIQQGLLIPIDPETVARQRNRLKLTIPIRPSMAT